MLCWPPKRGILRVNSQCFLKQSNSLRLGLLQKIRLIARSKWLRNSFKLCPLGTLILQAKIQQKNRTLYLIKCSTLKTWRFSLKIKENGRELPPRLKWIREGHNYGFLGVETQIIHNQLTLVLRENNRYLFIGISHPIRLLRLKIL